MSVVFFFLSISGMVFSDFPFGIEIDGAKWDKKRFTDEDISTILAQVAMLDDRTKSQVFVAYHDVVVGGEIESALNASGWVHRSTILTVWNTSTVNGGGARWTCADHRILVNFKNGALAGVWNGFSEKSQDRQNIIVNPIKREFTKYKGSVVNPTEKVVWIESMLMKRHCEPGTWVLCLCGGSGTTAVAALAAGFNVISMELDVHQFNATVARLNKYCNNPKVEVAHTFSPPSLSWSETDTAFLQKQGSLPAPKPSTPVKSDSVTAKVVSEALCVVCEDECGDGVERLTCRVCEGVVHKTPCGGDDVDGVDPEKFVCTKCEKKEAEYPQTQVLAGGNSNNDNGEKEGEEE